jgi:hypothetical protein
MMYVFRFHLYADDLQIYTVDVPFRDVNQLLALVNGELQSILDWAHDNSLTLIASNVQGLLILRRIRSEYVRSDVILGEDSVWLSDVVKNLGLYMNARLIWRMQVSYVVSCTFSTLRLLYRFQRYTSSSRDLKTNLVRSLIVYLYFCTLMLLIFFF